MTIREPEQKYCRPAITDTQALDTIINTVPRLSDTERVDLERLLLAECAIVTIPAGQVVIQSDQFSGCFYICLRGLLRNYYVHENGKIFNKSFIPAPSVAGTLSEYVTSQASRFSMDCLEESTLMKVRFDWLRTVESRPSIQKFYTHIVERLALLKERREESLLIDNARSRYLIFVENNPDLLQRLPDYHIAAYIGITPVAFSRLKKELLT